MFTPRTQIRILALFYASLISLSCYTQMTISLGDDTTYCKDLWFEPTSYLGTNLQIENGTEPFEYAWDCIYTIDEITFRASTFLNDTTIATPYLIAKPIDDDWLEMFLTVEDAENKIAKDSMHVRFSVFGYISDFYNISIQKGDSVQFFNEAFVCAGIAPSSFNWQPEVYLEDPNMLNTWCKPEISTDYYLIATDSVGCVSEPTLMYKILVNPVSISKTRNETTFYSYQNGEVFYFSNPNQNMAQIIVYDTKGALVFQTTSYSNQINLGSIIQRKGIYLVSMQINNSRYSGKFYKQ